MHGTTPHIEDQVAAIVTFFEQVTPGSLSVLDRIYAPGACFKDPPR